MNRQCFLVEEPFQIYHLAPVRNYRKRARVLWFHSTCAALLPRPFESTGIVMDSGEGVTQAVPIYEGVVALGDLRDSQSGVGHLNCVFRPDASTHAIH